MMQHIAVVRPEIAASSVETGKIGMPPRQQEGFSRHLEQHQQRDAHESRSQNERQAAQRRPDADNKRVDNSSTRAVDEKPSMENKREPAADKPVRKEPEEPSVQAKKSSKEAVDHDSQESVQNKNDQPQQQVKKDSDKTADVADSSDDIKAITENDAAEDKQAEEWLALVHKLVNKAQTAQADENAEGSGAELSDKHKALLEQLGLDAEKVLQQAEEAGKLAELKALLQGNMDNPEKGRQELALEQVLALLLTDEKGPIDDDAPVAQNHALGLKSAGDPAQHKISAVSELSNERLLDYQQRQDKNAGQSKDMMALLREGSDEARQAMAPAVSELSDNDKLKSATATKDGKETNPLQQLARLPEPALDKALQNLAERLPLKDSDPVVINSFIDNLKAGIEEFKQQRSQGREPGLDLQSLVSRAWAGESELQQGQQQSVLQAVKQFGESLSVVSPAVRSEINPAFAVSAAAERLGGQEAQVASETTKAAPNIVMERAVNIARPEAAGQLAERVRMLVNQGNMSADIRLDPPDLGSMQIRISMNGEQASVNFVVQSQQARDMLDQAVPRLREMLAERGIELGQSSVEQQKKDGSSGDTGGQSQMASAEADEELIEQQSVQGQEIRLANGALGGIDYFV
ncbi:flagellar hook-length control protein FliK [Lacimicrobium alkaliphilum]|uniref:Flagellar hook-length control protein-like C-terminal domain-containing protein n=1 Tax=Lacimicrobium alkaliphilum TaxID=1526571 RepID=A0A0U3AM19_9ALTE|nr:flagellar hook-length control protein FliK [Lacimicrobium alkaliphilum]ALS99026.1 hypothetical protein AT746_12630 [Lacimicrobium alkaliphilum]